MPNYQSGDGLSLWELNKSSFQPVGLNARKWYRASKIQKERGKLKV